MRDIPIRFDADKREEFKSIVSGLSPSDLGKSNFSIEHINNVDSGEHFVLRTEEKHTVEYVKDYSSVCPDSIKAYKDRVITAFDRDPMPCSKRFTAIMRNTEDARLPSCKIFGDMTEAAGIYHEMIAYMLPSGFFFSRMRKFFQYYMIFLYNLIKFSLNFVCDAGNRRHIVSHYRALVIAVMLTTKKSFNARLEKCLEEGGDSVEPGEHDVGTAVAAVNAISIEDILEEAHKLVPEETVKFMKTQIESFSHMFASCGADPKSPVSTKAISLSYRKW